MKVLFLFEGLPHYYNDVLNRLNALPDTQVSVLIPENNNTSLGKNVFQTDKGISFKVIRTEEYVAWYGKAFLQHVKSIIQSEQPDVIIAGWPYIQGIFLDRSLYRYIKANKIKLVEKSIPYLVPKYSEARRFYASAKNVVNETLTVTDKVSLVDQFKYFLITQFRKYYLDKLDAHVCYVEEAFDVLGSYGVDKEKIHIIYNSPDTDKIFQSKQKISNAAPILPANPLRIIHVGRLVKWKKVHYLVSIIEKLKKDFPQVELLVVGNGPEEEHLKQQANALGVAQQVRFVGGVYDPEVLGQYFQASAIYVLAGVGGLSINEAMCYEKPVICSVCDGTEKKLVRNNVNGFFFENDDEEDLYQKIHYLLGKPDLVKQMGDHSLQIIQQEINIHTVINGYAETFQYLAGKK
ncbi:MAG: hypothetical protein JWO58_431 [Chitinophagaceae bacterium]|nr:hypothetical protein [Chitinophagaceae bacterium]